MTTGLVGFSLPGLGLALMFIAAATRRTRVDRVARWLIIQAAGRLSEPAAALRREEWLAEHHEIGRRSGQILGGLPFAISTWRGSHRMTARGPGRAGRALQYLTEQPQLNFLSLGLGMTLAYYFAHPHHSVASLTTKLAAFYVTTIGSHAMLMRSKSRRDGRR